MIQPAISKAELIAAMDRNSGAIKARARKEAQRWAKYRADYGKWLDLPIARRGHPPTEPS